MYILKVEQNLNIIELKLDSLASALDMIEELSKLATMETSFCLEPTKKGNEKEVGPC